MSEIVLYMFPGACSRVSMTALEETGVVYEDRAVNLGGGVQNGADYLTLNRKGKVPVLCVDGQVLTENAAILAYLDRAYPQAALLPRRSDPFAYAQVQSDLIWCSSMLHPEVRQIRAPFKWTVGNPEDVRADGLKKFAKNCDHMTQRFAGGRWWYGEQWSIVDTYLYWAYSTAAIGGFPLHDYPELLAHKDRVRARPAFQRALKRELAAIARDNLPVEPDSL